MTAEAAEKMISDSFITKSVYRINCFDSFILLIVTNLAGEKSRVQ